MLFAVNVSGFVMVFVENEELNFPVNKLILGDNLEILKTLPEESIDLIYLALPFLAIEIARLSGAILWK